MSAIKFILFSLVICSSFVAYGQPATTTPVSVKSSPATTTPVSVKSSPATTTPMSIKAQPATSTPMSTEYKPLVKDSTDSSKFENTTIQLSCVFMPLNDTGHSMDVNITGELRLYRSWYFFGFGAGVNSMTATEEIHYDIDDKSTGQSMYYNFFLLNFFGTFGAHFEITKSVILNSGVNAGLMLGDAHNELGLKSETDYDHYQNGKQQEFFPDGGIFLPLNETYAFNLTPFVELRFFADWGIFDYINLIINYHTFFSPGHTIPVFSYYGDTFPEKKLIIYHQLGVGIGFEWKAL